MDSATNELIENDRDFLDVGHKMESLWKKTGCVACM